MVDNGCRDHVWQKLRSREFGVAHMVTWCPQSLHYFILDKGELPRRVVQELLLFIHI